MDGIYQRRMILSDHWYLINFVFFVLSFTENGTQWEYIPTQHMNPNTRSFETNMELFQITQTGTQSIFKNEKEYVQYLLNLS